MTTYLRTVPGQKVDFGDPSTFINLNEARRTGQTMGRNDVRSILISEASKRDLGSTDFLTNKSFGSMEEARIALINQPEFSKNINRILDVQGAPAGITLGERLTKIPSTTHKQMTQTSFSDQEPGAFSMVPILLLVGAVVVLANG